MKPSVIVWDLETVPDLGGFAAANDLVGKSDVEVREAIGDKFPKHIYHSIVCIGALCRLRFRNVLSCPNPLVQFTKAGALVFVLAIFANMSSRKKFPRSVVTQGPPGKSSRRRNKAPGSVRPPQHTGS